MKHITFINQVMEAGSVEQINNALRQADVQTASHVIVYCKEVLEERIEMHIQNGETKIALWNLSKLSYLEDYEIKLERSLHHVVSLQAVGI